MPARPHRNAGAYTRLNPVQLSSQGGFSRCFRHGEAEGRGNPEATKSSAVPLSLDRHGSFATPR